MLIELKDKTFVNSETGEELDLRVRFTNSTKHLMDMTDEQVKSHSVKDIFTAKAINGVQGITIGLNENDKGVTRLLDIRCVDNIVMITYVDTEGDEHYLPIYHS